MKLNHHMNAETFVVATVKSWNIEAFNRVSSKLQGNWTLISDPLDLTLDNLKSLNPTYVFFPHWSWIVPEDIFSQYDCVCFHMTDVPYGRGGSPLQNLILRGHETTKLSVLKMEKGLDAGPVYLKRDLPLDGTAEDILRRASSLIWDLIPEIVIKKPVPKAQTGDPVHFKRRKPSEGNLKNSRSLNDIYNYIRMLDGEGYPPAFIKSGDFEYCFTHASQEDDYVEARVKIRKRKKNNEV